MNPAAHIGSSIRIKGDVTAQEPLTIAGQVDGTVHVQGHAVTVTPEGRITATITADTLVVSGHVTGRLQAAARILVRETAVIEGDLAAPAVSVADGATVHGRIETAEKGAKTATVLQMAS